MGGLVAALKLAHEAFEVTVIERGSRPGGKMRVVEIGKVSLDAGPTVLTMRPILESVFAEVGEELSQFVTLKPADILARHAWNAEQRLDLYADLERSVEAIGDFAGAEQAERFRAFCIRASEIYQTLENTFIRKPLPTRWSLVRDAGFTKIARLRPYSKLWQELGEYFPNPLLRQLFGRYATYVGSSPFLAPPTLMLVAHVEMDGVWLVDGGMHRIPEALANLAVQRGATFRFGTAVTEIDIQRGQVAGVRLSTGEYLQTPTVIMNGDIAALATGRFGQAATRAVAPIPTAARSLSAVTWNLHARTEGFPLARHNVFFCNDYPAEFDDILTHARLPGQPTVYVCAQDRGDDDETRIKGPERLLCLVNAPPRGDIQPFTPTEIEECEAQTFELLDRYGLHVKKQPATTVVTQPTDFDRLFPATGGALYGRASHGWQGPFSRPGARSRVRGLYLTGGSVHPGPGVPMTAISGQMAAQAVLKDLISTTKSRPTVTPGGTSTP